MIELPDNSLKVWNTFFKENQVVVYKYVFKEVKKAIKNKEDKIQLFKFKEKGITATIKDNNFQAFLNTAFDVFVENEEYEYAEKVKKLLIDYQIEKVIRESINLEE